MDFERTFGSSGVLPEQAARVAPEEAVFKIRRTEMVIRYVSMPDAYAPAREDYLSRIVEEGEKYRFARDDARCVSLACGSYDALVMGGNNPAGLGGFVEEYRAILGQKLKICLMYDAHPRWKAHVIGAGFDDVFDITETSPLEAVARIRRMWHRYLSGIRNASENAFDERRLRAVAEFDRLSRREKIVILKLLDGGCTTPSNLVAAICSQNEYVSDQNISVLLAKLRVKLKSHVGIKYYKNLGYNLCATKDDYEAIS